MAYKPMTPFATALILMKPFGSSSAYGVAKHDYSVRNQATIYGTVRTFGGSESTENGVYSIVDTAMIDTWYRPDITPGWRSPTLRIRSMRSSARPRTLRCGISSCACGCSA